MSFNGSGTFNINTAGQPVVTGTTISTTAFNALTADLATGLTDCVTRDGQSPATANLPLGNNKITGLANGTVATDAAAFGQLSTFGVPGYTTTATAAGTTTLTVASTYNQFFTGTTTQTVVLPVTSTLVLGFQFGVVNNSTGVVTVNSSGSNLVASIPGSTEVILTCILTSGTTAASWDVKFAGATTETGTGGLVRDTSPALVAPVLGTPASGALTNCTSIPGAQINAGTIATAALADNAVTNAKQAQMTAHTLKVNISGSTANATDSSLTSVLDAEISSTQGSIAYRSGSGWVALAPGTSGQALISGGGAANVSWVKRNACMQFFSGVTTIPAGATRFLGGGVDSTESTIRFRAPFNCSAKAMYAICSTAPTAGQTFAYVLMVNGGAGNNTCTIADTAISAEDTSHTDTFTAGQTITVRVITSASAASATHSVTVELQGS